MPVRTPLPLGSRRGDHGDRLFTCLPAELRTGGEETVQVGRQPPGQRFVALDHLEHRLLLAEEILVRAGHDGDGAVAAEPGHLEVLDCLRDESEFAFEAGLEADERCLGLDGHRGDDEAFDELIRIGSDQRPVLERTRLTFGAVAHHETPSTAVRRDPRPLVTGRETTTAPSPQTRSAYLVDRGRRTERESALDAGSAGRCGQILIQRGDRLARQEERRHIDRVSDTVALF